MTYKIPRFEDGKAEIRFEPGDAAAVVVGNDGADPRTLLSALGLEIGRPVLVVCGGASGHAGEGLARAELLLGPAVAAAAELTGAAVVDGGTAAGVMALIGAARAQRDRALPVLLGVAPAGRVALPASQTPEGEERVALEPHHTHFVLADSGEWGGETGLLFDLAEALADGARVATLLAGGGAVAQTEAHEAMRRRWPVFVIEGTGGTADTIAALWRMYREPQRHRFARLLRRGYKHRKATAPGIENAALGAIVREGDVRRFADADPGQLARRLAWELQDEPVLKAGWRTFATYDGLANRLRRSFERIQGWILGLGILGTLVALLHEALGTAVLHWAAVSAPLLVATLIALAGRRAAGKRWVLLRAAAESVKAEIYRYRTRTGVYNDVLLPDGDPVARPRVLAEQLDAIEARLMQTEASSGALTPYDGPLPPEMYGAGREDDGLSALDAERYLQLRISDQMAYYHARTRRLDRRRNAFQLLAVVGGGAGAILAAAGLEIWIGLTTAVSGAALSYLAYLQVENTIVAYNQSAAKLTSLEREWRARGPDSPESAAFDQLVSDSEAVLATELGGWVQQMQEALEEQRAQQAEAARQVGVEKDVSRPRAGAASAELPDD